MIIKYTEMLNIKKAYSKGINITDLLKKEKNINVNALEIIEAAYDLQAGTYIEHAEKNKVQISLYVAEIADIINKHINYSSSILDIGTGEMTTLSLLTQYLKIKPQNIFAFDISWSRIYKGLDYAKKNMAQCFEILTPFVADISEIPLLDKSIDITISSHALEPNGDKLSLLMKELFRITKDKLILFEPCYEINNEEGKERMNRLGYIKNVHGVVNNLGGTLIDKIKIQNVDNPLNPTACFVIAPPKECQLLNKATHLSFSAPGTNHPIIKIEEFYFSNASGLCFPILKSIPILKYKSAILASALS